MAEAIAKEFSEAPSGGGKSAAPKRKKWHRNNVEVFIMAMAGLIFLAVFSYAPMVGIILAFKDADNTLDLFGAMFGGEWAQMHGFFNFYRFVTDIDFWNVILNTLGFNILNLVIALPLPVILALMFSEMKHARLSKGIQFFMFLPHFLSIVVYVGIVWAMLDDGYGGGVGVINVLIEAFGGDRINFKASPQYSWAIMIVANVLKSSGWGSIIYLAAITGVDVELYDAAALDGVNRFQKAWYITLPTVMPVFTLNLITSLSGILGNDSATMLLWQTQMNLSRTEVLSTYVLKYGINNMQYSYATAIGLFQSVIGVILICASNWVTKKINGEGVIF